MLQGRLIGVAVTIGLSAVVAGCGDGSDGAIADNLIEPGVTAINEAHTLACDGDLRTLDAAIEAYSLLENQPPADEATLIAARLLRTESLGWDIVNGQVVAADPECGEVGAAPLSTAVPITAPAETIGQIVTDTEPLQTPEQILADLGADEIAALGGHDCANELVSIFAASQRYAAERGTDPETFDDLFADGYLTALPSRWAVDAGRLVAVERSGCVTPSGDPIVESCQIEAKTLAVARDAYYAMNPEAALEPTTDDLVAAGLLRAPFEGVYLVDGVVVPTIGGPCEAVDLDP